MAENFWTKRTTSPKRSFRFLLSIEGIGGQDVSWLVTQVKKPTATVGEVSHKYLNHTFYYPGRVEWDTVNVTLVDPVSPSAAGLLANVLEKSGYKVPSNSVKTDAITKEDSVKGLGTVTIKQFQKNADSEDNIVEEWTLKNAFITNVDWGELNYESDDLTNCTLTIRYDWAELTTRQGNDGAENSDTRDTGDYFKSDAS